jgi:1,4-dihydroxy-2-naphthoate octaprenyltransferase
MKAEVWIQAVRLKFLPQGVMPILIGTAVAYRSKGVFFLGLFILAFLGMMLVQFALTMLDDWHDYMRGTDTTATDEKNPYTGGSGVLVDGTITPKEMITVVALFYITATLIGFYLTYLRGIEVLYIMLAGLFISIFYSLHPFQFAYRGLGEFMMLLGYGPTITLGAYFVQAQDLGLQAFLAGLLPGMLMWAMIIVNEIPDYEEDRATGKKNLAVRFGKEAGVRLFTYGLLTIYLYVVTLVLFGIFPLGTLLSLVSIPFAERAVRQLKEHYQDKIEVAVANREMVKVYSTTTLLFAIGFLI